MDAISQIRLVRIVRPNNYRQRTQIERRVFDRPQVPKLELHNPTSTLARNEPAKPEART